MTNQPSSFCHTFWYGSHSHSDRVCTRSGAAVQTASTILKSQVIQRLSVYFRKCSRVLLVPVYNTRVYGTCNTAVQLGIVNWLLDGIGELVSLCDSLHCWGDVIYRFPAAWTAVGFRMQCQYINIANSSTQCSRLHAPISHLWIAWTYSESLCCCAFKVTPIAVSGTEGVSEQNWAHTVGFRNFGVGRNNCSNKNNSKIGTEEMEGSQYKLPGTSGLERVSEPLSVSYVLVYLGIIIFGRFSNKPIRKSLWNWEPLFFLFDALAAGLVNVVNWTGTLSRRPSIKLHFLSLLAFWVNPRCKALKASPTQATGTTLTTHVVQSTQGHVRSDVKFWPIHMAGQLLH